MIWWWQDQRRARAEKAAFVALQDEHDWVAGVHTRYLAEYQLCVDVKIVHNGKTFELAVIYFATFPTRRQRFRRIARAARGDGGGGRAWFR